MEENGDEGDEDDDDEDDMDETDIEGLLDAEFDEDEDLDEEEEETEEDAVDRLRSEIVDRFDEDNARLGVVQVLYRTVLGGGGEMKLHSMEKFFILQVCRTSPESMNLLDIFHSMELYYYYGKSKFILYFHAASLHYLIQNFIYGF